MFFYDLQSKSQQRWRDRAAEYQQRMTEQQIVPGNPGTILQDIATMIEFIGPGGLVTKSRNATLPSERLAELNAKSSYPIELDLKRTVLRDYPNLAGLFVLLRALDLLQVEGTRLALEPAALDVWGRLNPTERYFTLLEALCFQAQTAMLGGGRIRGYEETEMFQGLLFFLSQLSRDWRQFDAYQAVYVLGPKGHLPPWSLFLLQQLGLIQMRPRSLSEDRGYATGRGWLIGGARLTPWGEAVTWALLEFDKQEMADADQVATDQGELPLAIDQEKPREASDQGETGKDEKEVAESATVPEEEDLEDVFGSEEPEVEFGVLQPVFQPYFPEWQRVYERPRRGFRPGTYIFKVSLGGWRGGDSVWRRLAVPADTSLEQLAGAILKAFKFDSDHLYDFRYRDHRGKSRVYNHPFSQDGPWATDITVGETELGVKDEMLFTFDYGDNWEFRVRLEQIDPDHSRLRGPSVIKSAGKAPEQYPQSEEW